MAVATESLLPGIAASVTVPLVDCGDAEQLRYQYQAQATKREIKSNAALIGWAVDYTLRKASSANLNDKFSALIAEGKEAHELAVELFRFRGTMLSCNAQDEVTAADKHYAGETVASYLHPSQTDSPNQSAVALGYTGPEGASLRLTRLFSSTYPVCYIASAFIGENITLFHRYDKELESPSPDQFKVYECVLMAKFNPRGLSKWTAANQDRICDEWGIKTLRVLRKARVREAVAEEERLAAQAEAELAQREIDGYCGCCYHRHDYEREDDSDAGSYY
jgi:hypothetical protein